jgi:predicted TIM-barrel fold metal-dependent hydrolase
MHQDFEDFSAEIDRCEAMGLSGIKIHPDIQRMDIGSAEMYRLCELLESRMPLFLHMGDNRPEYRYSEPRKLARLVRRFPRLEVIAAHFGGYRAWDEAEQYLYGFDNIWYDLSSALWAMSPEKACRLIHACGAGRVMFGTDYPVMRPAEYFSLFMQIELDEQERRDILYNNAKRFFKKNAN